jgi:carbon storage regulator
MEESMLVFSRKIGEGLVLPSCGVVVTVTRVAGKRVRLSVLAPPEVQVHRTEVLQRIHREAGAGEPGGDIRPEPEPEPRYQLPLDDYCAR